MNHCPDISTVADIMPNHEKSYDLAIKLAEVFFRAPKREKILRVQLFAIEYGHDIRSHNFSVEDIVRRAGIGKHYYQSMTQGVRLSEYVELRHSRPEGCSDV